MQYLLLDFIQIHIMTKLHFILKVDFALKEHFALKVQEVHWVQSAPYPQSVLDIKSDSDSYTILYWNSDTVYIQFQIWFQIQF